MNMWKFPIWALTLGTTSALAPRIQPGTVNSVIEAYFNKRLLPVLRQRYFAAIAELFLTFCALWATVTAVISIYGVAYRAEDPDLTQTLGQYTASVRNLFGVGVPYLFTQHPEILVWGIITAAFLWLGACLVQLFSPASSAGGELARYFTTQNHAGSPAKFIFRALYSCDEQMVLKVKGDETIQEAFDEAFKNVLEVNFEPVVNTNEDLILSRIRRALDNTNDPMDICFRNMVENNGISRPWISTGYITLALIVAFVGIIMSVPLLNDALIKT